MWLDMVPWIVLGSAGMVILLNLALGLAFLFLYRNSRKNEAAAPSSPPLSTSKRSSPPTVKRKPKAISDEKAWKLELDEIQGRTR